MTQRPFYLVAHRANDVSDIRSALASGANAIEGDVRANVVDHDGTFPWSTRLDAWLEEIARAARTDESFALLYLDVKEPTALASIASKVSAIVPPQVPVLFSVSSFSLRNHLAALAPSLTGSQGICIDEHDDPDEVETFFSETGLGRCWYGNGIFVAGPPWELPHIETSIRSAVAIRNAGRDINRVVVWTLARESSMRQFVEIGVDAILANQDSLATLSTVIDTNSTVRRATQHDAPF